MAEQCGPRQKVLKSLALSTPPAPPALNLALAMVMALVPQSLAPVLKSLARKPCPFTDLFCWTLLMSTASVSRPETCGASMICCTQKSGEN